MYNLIQVWGNMKFAKKKKDPEITTLAEVTHIQKD